MQHSQSKQTTLYQIAPTYFVEEGYYYTNQKADSIRLPNAYGLGAFQGLDGELVVFDGVVYHGDQNCNLTVVKDERLLTTATVVQFFGSAPTYTFFKIIYADFIKALREIISVNAYPVAFKIVGFFSDIEIRSLIKQPNGPLDLERQPIVRHKNISGSLIGFHFPSYFKNINTTGFHFHFIDHTKKIGGHVNSFDIAHAEVALHTCKRIMIDFSEYQP